MMEEYDPLNVQAMDLAARDTVAMYQRILYVDHDNTVMMHFPVFSLTGSSEVFSGYYAREFIVPDEPYSLTNAYRWFFGELGQETDGAYTDTYAIMLLEAAFQSPDLFLEYLAECTDATISMYRDWMHNVIVSQEEYNLYVQLLVAISSRTDLTADENDALELLADAPDWFAEGVNAALLAPTAANQQKFQFAYCDGEAHLRSKGIGTCLRTDLGIVKYHFEAVTGKTVIVD
jgi:hypothetical protein